MQVKLVAEAYYKPLQFLTGAGNGNDSRVVDWPLTKR